MDLQLPQKFTQQSAIIETYYGQALFQAFGIIVDGRGGGWLMCVEMRKNPRQRSSEGRRGQTADNKDNT